MTFAEQPHENASGMRRRIFEVSEQRERLRRASVSATLVVSFVGILAVAASEVENRLVISSAVLVMAGLLLLLLKRLAGVFDEVRTLADCEARFRALVQHAADVILIVDTDGSIRYASPAARDVFGERPDALGGKRLTSVVHPQDATAVERCLAETAQSPRHTIVREWRVHRSDGEWLWTENTATNLIAEPSVRGIVLSCRDITERRTLEHRLAQKAFHDGLTRLANRALFMNRLAHVLAMAQRGAHPAAVLFLDLDDFKKVNDSLGHAVGDELLVAAAGRLEICVRPGDTIARLGGDEFAVLLADVDEPDDVVQVAERITTALSTPFRVSGREVFISVSIGIAAVSLGDTPDVVVRNADLAMYLAKGRRKGGYAIYERGMHAQLMDRLELEADLRTAVDRNDIRIEYQPIVNLVTSEVHGAEALVRWRHSARGNVPPSRFISIAEDTGLIIPIGRMVLREACQRAVAWRSMSRRTRSLRMSVNLSGRHFQEGSLVEDVQLALRESGLDAGALTLEITESVLMQRSETTLDRLRALKAMGLSLAIDDFGTGYSSLGYLQQFPIDMLKIDRTFVDVVGEGDADPVLARAIIALGKTLRIETVAEGIERPQQRDGLRALGCTLGQGYLFARPMPPEEFSSTVLTPVGGLSVVDMYGPEVVRG
jgi:diguanylate cyclase (GGDEF)-like protein/PAS domain S-box-containing protein